MAKKRENRAYSGLFMNVFKNQLGQQPHTGDSKTKRLIAVGLAALIFLTCGCALKGEVSGASAPPSSSSDTLSLGLTSTEEASKIYSSSPESKVTSAEESKSSSDASKVESSAPAKEYTSTPEQDRAKVLVYMAGGEYTNNTDNTIFALTDKFCGATVVFSKNTEPLTQDALNNSVISKIRGNLKSTDVVYVQNGEAYVFNSNNLKAGYRKITKYDQSGSKSIVENTNQIECYWLKIVWDKDGIGLSDDTKITYWLENGKFVESENSKMLGTQEQRIGHLLKSFLNGDIYGRKNNLNLKVDEVNQYLNTGSDEGLTSFQVIKSQEVAFIAVTGGRWGLNELYLKSTRKAVARLDQIDPDIMKYLVEKNGLQVVTFDSEYGGPNLAGMFVDDLSTGAVFDSCDLGNIIYINQTRYDEDLRQTDINKLIDSVYVEVMEFLLVESRGIYALNNKNLGSIYDSTEIELYKTKWTLAQVEKYKAQMTELEYFCICQNMNNVLKMYS